MRYSEISLPPSGSSDQEGLEEHAIAKPGDWDGASMMLTSISQFMFERAWRVVGQMMIEREQYSIGRLDNDTTHLVVGRMVDGLEDKVDPEHQKPRFAVVCRMELERSQDVRLARLGEMYKVFAVGVVEELRAQQIAKRLYRWLVQQHGMTIVGDKLQYFGARRLWASLSRDTDLTVDIIDVANGQTMETNVILHHGRYDHDFDQRVWSYGRDKEDLRLVLRDLTI